MSKVSVVVPIYNCKNSIEKCVRSIMDQTYSELEILLVDDGSNDGTDVICDVLAKEDARIRVIHKKNGGVSSARNSGIERATGKYLMFADSDDFLAADYAETMVRSMEEDACQLVISGYTYVLNDGNKSHVCDRYVFEDKSEFIRKFGVLYEEYFLHVVWNKIFLRELVKNRFDENISLGEDLLFVLAYLKNVQKIKVIDTAGYYYVFDQTPSLTNKFRKNAFEIAELLYENAMEYISGYENAEAEQAVRKLFLDDVSKFVKDVLSNNKISKKERQNYLKNVSTNANFLKAFTGCKQLGKRQRIVFYLLKWKCFKLAEKVGK